MGRNHFLGILFCMTLSLSCAQNASVSDTRDGAPPSPPPSGLRDGNDVLRVENEALRSRLRQAISDLYAASPRQQRGELLRALLAEPLATVRLAGIRLASRSAAAGEPMVEETLALVRGLLDDASPAVREEAALLLADAGDGETVEALLARAESESVPAVRRSILTALGRIGEPRALPTVLEATRDEGPQVAGAGAFALAQIATRHEIPEQLHAQAVETLLERLRTARRKQQGPQVREAILAAMGAVGDPRFEPVLREALDDEAAVVRMAAIDGLVRCCDEPGEAIARLASNDPDRGVRQAALTALGEIDGHAHLPTILERTDPARESDAGVRGQAWGIARQALPSADRQTLVAASEMLARREDPAAAEQRIEVLQALIGVLGEQKEPGLDEADARWRLGTALAAAGRPAEAAPHFRLAWVAYRDSGRTDAAEIWRQWVRALLSADDVAVVTALAEQEDSEEFARGVAALVDRLEVLDASGGWTAEAALASAALRELAPRLNDEKRAVLQRALAEARDNQAQADRQAVADLVALLGGDGADAQAAAGELISMGPRAVVPLLQAFRGALRSDQASPRMERAFLDVLDELAPELSGYDVQASRGAKLRRIDDWLAER